MKWLILTMAIIAEVIGTSALKDSEGFTKLIPSFFVVLGYCLAFYFLSLTLNEINIGVSYALWSGVGIVLISIIGFFRFDQRLDAPALIGIGLIVLGVIVMSLFSKTLTH